MQKNIINLSTQVIIAALNEQQGIGPTISELLENLDTPRLLIVDGQSTDRTVDIAKSMGAEIIFQTEKGKGDAIAKALKHIDPQTSYIVLTDADHTYPCSAIPEMIEKIQANPMVGMVCGNRFNKKLDPKSLKTIFNIGNQLIRLSHILLNRVLMKDPLTGLRVIRADILRNYHIKSKGFDIEVELNSLVLKRGFDILEIEIDYRERLGEKKLKLKYGFEILKRIILESLNL